MYAYQMIGVDGRTFDDIQEYLRHLAQHLPESYLAGKDFEFYAELLKKVVAGELKPEEAAHQSPSLARVGGSCPCSKAVRWINGNGNGKE